MDAKTITEVSALRKGLEELSAQTSPDLTLRQLLVLLTVGGSTSTLTQQQLGEITGEYKSTISKIVSALAGTDGDVRRPEGLGLLRVDLDPGDMRVRLVSLTKEGEKVLARLTRVTNRGQK